MSPFRLHFCGIKQWLFIKSHWQAVVTFLLDHLTQKTRWKTARFRVFSLGQSGVACVFFFQGVLGANEILPVCWSKVQRLRLKNYLVAKKFFAWEKGGAWEKCFTGWCSTPTLLRPFARHLGSGKLSSIAHLLITISTTQFKSNKIALTSFASAQNLDLLKRVGQSKIDSSKRWLMCRADLTLVGIESPNKTIHRNGAFRCHSQVTSTSNWG